jgi:hypothetical protein
MSTPETAVPSSAVPPATELHRKKRRKRSQLLLNLRLRQHQSMTEAVGVGGAEMGQRSARVTASAPSSSAQRLSTESLSSQGTWMPTFGVQGLDVSGHQPER